MYDEIENKYNLTLRPSRLERLNSVLNYQLPTSLVYLVAFAYPFVTPILIAGAILFTPYLLYVLIKEKKTGWVVGFIIWVIMPVLLSLLLLDFKVYYTIVMAAFLAFFYLFCLVLKMSTREWVTAENARKQLEYQRKLRKIQDDIFFNRFDDKNLQ